MRTLSAAEGLLVHGHGDDGINLVHISCIGLVVLHPCTDIVIIQIFISVICRAPEKAPCRLWLEEVWKVGESMPSSTINPIESCGKGFLRQNGRGILKSCQSMY